MESVPSYSTRSIRASIASIDATLAKSKELREGIAEAHAVHDRIRADELTRLVAEQAADDTTLIAQLLEQPTPRRGKSTPTVPAPPPPPAGEDIVAVFDRSEAGRK